MATLYGFYLALLITYCGTTQAADNTSEDNSILRYVDYNGRTVLMRDDLFRKLADEADTWHWMPWQRIRTKVDKDVITEVDCSATNSIESFPNGILTDEQLRRGGFLLYFFFGAYAFTLLAFICNDYFIPTVELICDNLKIPQHVAAATFMAVATSCPEFFVNIISTFLTKSDMGIGTIVGSAIFNALGVSAIGGIAAIRPIVIEVRPVTRDVLIYLLNVSVLVSIVWDGEIHWYEALTLLGLYVFYFFFMFNSMRLFRLFDKLIALCCYKHVDSYNCLNLQNFQWNLVSTTILSTCFSVLLGRTWFVVGFLVMVRATLTDENVKVPDGVDNLGVSVVNVGPEIVVNGLQPVKVGAVDEANEEEEQESLWKYPKDQKLLLQIFWLYSWPLKFILGMTIPSPVTCKKWFPLTFVMCIIWIGLNSYCVTWSMTVIGHTFFIPDSVMGMTFLAFGGCLPEACAIFIMSRRGEGGMGVSNALGANSLAILFALGVPWLARTLTLLGEGAENPVVYINSTGIEFIVGSLLIAVSCLWLTLYFNKFVLKQCVGYIFTCLYVVFVTFALLVEMGIIHDLGVLPLCGL